MDNSNLFVQYRLCHIITLPSTVHLNSASSKVNNSTRPCQFSELMTWPFNSDAVFLNDPSSHGSNPEKYLMSVFNLIYSFIHFIYYR